MPFSTFKSIVDQCATYRHVLIRVVGLGEASMHPQFKECMEYLREKKIPVEITSNGGIFNVLDADEIINSSIVSLSISIDGFGDGTYEKLRPGGNYAELRQGIIRFYTQKKKSGKSPYFTIRNVLLGKTEAHRAEQAQRFKGEWADYCDRISFNDYIPAKLKAKNDNSDRVCDDVIHNLHIDWNGEVPLCTLQHTICDAEYTGNVNSSTLDEIWHHPRRQAVRMAHLSGDLQCAEFCTSCPKTRSGGLYRSVAKHGANRHPVLHNMERAVWRVIRGKA
jgi:MoaA/NifB/PqqE/SkfB family radical SAM enzyme